MWQILSTDRMERDEAANPNLAAAITPDFPLNRQNPNKAQHAPHGVVYARRNPLHSAILEIDRVFSVTLRNRAGFTLLQPFAGGVARVRGFA
jgi:hypothetical protein